MTLEKKVLIIVGLAAAAHSVYFFVFLPVRVTLSVVPEALEPGGSGSAEIRVVQWNRLSAEVPWKRAKVRYTILEGAGLVSVRQTSDSTSVVVTARDGAGVAAFRIVTDVSPLPLYCRIPIAVPVAEAPRGMPRVTAEAGGPPAHAAEQNCPHHDGSIA